MILVLIVEALAQWYSILSRRKDLCFMNRPTSPRGGPRTSLAPPTEMTDEKDCKD